MSRTCRVAPAWLPGALATGLALAPAMAAGTRAAAPRGPAAPAARAVPGDPGHGYRILVRECLKCHGEGTTLSGLDLRTQATAIRGGAHGAAVVPGKPDASRLYRMVAGQAKPHMPPTGALPDADVRAIRAWIAAGARYPASAARAEDRGWWAFRPIRPVTPPAVRDSSIRNPIDAFLLASMQSAGVRPNPPADRLTLIRRATYDLHGLPPTPEEVEEFLADRSPDAYPRLIDRLLASPRYGERQARHWLDLARFAESEGFKSDETRPNAWRYRDYVIRSFNEDKPYDRFIREQIAGDELEPHNPQALVATGFNRHWADESNARNLRLRRQEILNDITDTVGSVILGLTVGCARCHDHKYDPITHRDYYQLQAFFAAAQPRDDLPLLSPEEQKRHDRRAAQWEERTREFRQRLAALEAPHRERLMTSKRMPFTPEVQEAIDTPPAERTALQWQLFLKVSPQLEIKVEDLGKAMKGKEKEQWEALRSEMDRFADLKPPAAPMAIGITDVGRQAPPVHTLAVGVYDQPLEEVQPGFLSALGGGMPVVTPPAGLASTGRRTALARWLSSPENPLVPRVMANRLWQQHFGRGLVGTSSDLGRTGELPSHPELLEWLARQLLDGGWHLKSLHRLMMTSRAYQQSSSADAASMARDPENRLVWRYRRWRLEGEALRDAALLASGQLNLKMGGPSVFPELPEGVVTRGGWPVTPDAAERNRRSVYVFVRRNLRYPLFEAFDFPDTHEPCARRSVTNTAPQALMLFNSKLALDQARHMAGRLAREAESLDGRIERAYRLAFGRAPETAERELTRQFLARQAELVGARLRNGEATAQPVAAPPGLPAAEGAALVDLCHALLNANEFLYVD